ncbi:uncharacterized protein si:dkeyp-118a3.2 [Mugil cephalus]|uniref:uncharacterized protein si:dkeyp-118a3.2 n=1 Tax=Mugil cephalus TaxID=48193 RepID=UPI001FB5888E|nr:uncharacterized protein si:dkeyp-118a3.2 [Mugil cephalus]
MDYCTLKGFLVVLLIQRCTSEGLSPSIQTSTVVNHQDGQISPKEPELPPAEVVPIVSPPSLKEVQQAVQEASEQVEGRGAEEVLKELLERVVEAALGQVEGGSDAKEDALQGAVEEKALGAETGETEAEAEVLKVANDENMGFKEGDTSVEEKREVVDAFEVAAEEGKGVVEGEAGAETGLEITDESLGSRFSQDIVEGAGAALEETAGDIAVEETRERNNREQEMSEEEEGEGVSESEESPSVVEVTETTEETEPILGVADVEQAGHALGKDEAVGEESQVDEMEGEAMALPSDNYEIETTQTAAGEAVEEEEELNTENDSEGHRAQDEQTHLGKGGTAEEVEVEATSVREATGEEGGVSIREESVALVNEGGDRKAGEEEEITSETSQGGEKEDQEAPVSSGPQAGDGAGTTLEIQTPTRNPALGGAEETGGNAFGDGNEIITPTDNLMSHDPAAARPTLDIFPLAGTAQAEGAEPGEAKELVEDTAGATEMKELGLEAWKIGAIFAAVFLILEAVVIVVYVLKCRNKTSIPALQRACEEGCVEPEVATGSDCCDETLPAGNGDTQQIAALDPSDVASALAAKKEQQQDENAIAMSDLPPSSTEESGNTGPGPDSSQDLRTSIL